MVEVSTVFPPEIKENMVITLNLKYRKMQDKIDSISKEVSLEKEELKFLILKVNEILIQANLTSYIIPLIEIKSLTNDKVIRKILDSITALSEIIK